MAISFDFGQELRRAYQALFRVFPADQRLGFAGLPLAAVATLKTPTTKLWDERWRLDGPHEPAAQGWTFDPSIELVDPWARAVDATHWEDRKSVV